MFNESEVLLTIAELALAVAGFSGVAIVFKRKPGALTDAEVYRIALLFANATAAMFISLLVFPLQLIVNQPEHVWRAASALTAVFSAVFLYYMLGMGWRLYQRIPQLFTWWFMVFTSTGHTINVMVQLLNALGVFGDRSAVFVCGVLWLLFHSTLQFGRILFVQPPGLEGEPAHVAETEVPAE